MTLNEKNEPKKYIIVEEEISVDDEDVYLPDLFECTPSFASNKDSISAYLAESSLFPLHDLSIFDINSTKTNAFNLGTPEDPKEILMQVRLLLRKGRK